MATAASTGAFRIAPGGALRGGLRVPGDKSISHRAVLLGAIAEGETQVSGLLEGADVLATVAAMRALGVAVDGPQGGAARIRGVGLGGLRAPAAPLDLGNSGTSMRLLAGLLAGQPFASELTGDASLRRRPMDRVIEPLARMGARIEAAPGGCAPLRIAGGARLAAIDYELPVASAQVKSAVLLAGLYASGRTCVTEPAPTRDHTERMLAGLGVAVARDGPTACVSGGAGPRAAALDVPGDLSSAAFFLVGASIAEGSEVVLRHVGINPTRAGVLELLRRMGAAIEVAGEREVGGEPVADLHVRGARLRGIEVPPELVPLAIDEFPALLVAAACAEGETTVSGAGELRVKESDRLAAMAEGLAALGVAVEERPDGIRVEGRERLAGGEVASHGDHRVAMALALAALRAEAEVVVRDTGPVATSYPGFAADARALGLAVEER